MTQEALKLALEALENAEYGDYDKEELNKAITIIKEALAQPDPYKQGYADALNWKVQNHLEHLPTAQPEQEPVCPDCKAKVLYECVACSSNNYPPKTEQEPVAWPCLIAEADFSEDTVTLAMQCTDYKVSAGKHWLSNTPPQRTWVGLTDEEYAELAEEFGPFPINQIEAKLKEKNT